MVNSHLQSDPTLSQDTPDLGVPALKNLEAVIPGMVYQFRLTQAGHMAFSYMSESCQTLYGVSPSAAMAEVNLILDATHPSDRPALEASIADSAQTLAPWQWEGRIITTAGDLKWVRGTAAPEQHPNGDVIWDGMLIDITDQKQVETELRRSQQQRSALLNNAPIVLYTLDREGNFLTSEGQGLQSVGLTPGQVVGQSIFELYQDAPTILDFISKGLAGEEGAALTNFGEVWFESFCTPLYDEQGNRDGLIGIAVDISDRKRDELKRAATELELKRSQSELQAILDNAPTVIYTKDLAGRYTLSNTAFEQLFDQSRHDFLGKTDYHLMPQATADAIVQADRRVIATGQPIRLEENIIAADQTKRTHVTVKFPLRDLDGSIYAVCGLSTDITERKAAETELLLFKQALDSSSDAIGIADARGNHFYQNQSFSEMYDCESVEAFNEYGGIPAVFVNPQVAPEIFRAIGQGKSWSGEVEQRSHTGRVLSALLRANPIKDNQGRTLGIIGSHTDISERKQFEAQLKQQTCDLELALKELRHTQSQLIQTEKMSSLGQLVAGVAHEINNPVSFIYGNLNYAQSYLKDLFMLLDQYETCYPQPVDKIQLLKETVDIDFLREDLPNLFKSMESGAARIKQIVLSLRTFSRMDEEGRKWVDLQAGIDSALMLLQHRLRRREQRPEIQVSRHFCPQLPQVECYAGQLNQVFMNLLSNAIDALEDRWRQDPSQPLQIDLYTKLTDDGRVAGCVYDNGAGIDAAVRNRIFDPFFTTKAVGKGTGMGLATSYQIIAENHGGSLTCASRPGHGAQFRICMPISSSNVL